MRMADDMEGPTFALTKEWVDPSPGIELVEVHYVWGPLGEPPDWEGNQTAVATPLDAGPPPRRAAPLELPRFVDGATDYLLHYFFFVAGGGAQGSTPVFTEQIGTREPYAGNAVPNQDRSRGQVEPVEQACGQEV